MEMVYRFQYLYLAVVLVWIPGMWCSELDLEVSGTQDAVEEDWGDGLKVLSIYKPTLCEYQAKKDDIIHYHYVGRLASDGTEFGKSFDYNSPYIVALGHGRIIAGMDRGLMGTCLWERRRISFPPHLGYGERGVGKTIPPNASLVFYIRLIKIERNGHALGEDADLSGIWSSAMSSYSDKDWEKAIDMIEEAIRLFDQYEKQSLICHKECEGADSLVSEKNKKVLEDYIKGDIISEGLVHFSAKGKCLRECKSKNLPPQLRQPDPLLIQKFRRRLPYSFLHFSYYQNGQTEMGARSCFTYLHYNPTDEQTLSNIIFYRHALNLTNEDFIYPDATLEEYQKPYIEAKLVYWQDKWLEAADLFEASLMKLKRSLEDCYLLCEDVVDVNLTQPDMSSIKRDLLQEYGFKSDSMEYYEILLVAIKEVLKCQSQCYYQAAVIEGQHIPNYLSSHFDFLQYIYYKLGNMVKAAKSAATFLEIQPSDDAMTKNVHFYTSEFDLSSEDFVPRNEFVQIYRHHEMDERLLQFVEDGMMRKKGVREDTGDRPKDEL